MNTGPSAPLEPAHGAPGPQTGATPRKRGANRRTLKKRVRRLIYSSSFINIGIFACVMLTLVVFIFKPISDIASNYISSSLAEEINSRPFLDEMSLQRLEDFDASTPEASVWLNAVEKMTKIDYFIPFMEWDAAKPIETAKGDLHLSLEDKADEGDMIFVDIELNGESVYKNGDAMAANGLLQAIGVLYDDARSVKPLLGAQGRQIGSVSVGIAPVVQLFALGLTMVLFVVMAGIMLVITSLLSHLFSIPILKPLMQLNANIKAIADDHYEEVADNRLGLKRPLREIEALADSTNLIMGKMRRYADMLESQRDTLEAQNEELEAQNIELQESKAAIQAAQLEIMQKEASLRNLLNHAGQGFLTFGEDLRIHPVYSLACGNILLPGVPIAGERFPELVAQGDNEHRLFMENILVKILQERDHGKRAVYTPLLTEEVDICGRCIHIDYKIIPDPERAQGELFMAVLTDITEKRALQTQMEAERNMLKTVVKVMAGYADFSASVKDFRQFMALDLAQIAAKHEAYADLLAVLFRQFHTYKGTFAQWGLTHITARLHDTESMLSRLGKQPADAAHDSAALLGQIRELGLEDALGDDLAELKAMVGSGFFDERDVLVIDRMRLLEIEKKMLGTLSPLDCKLLLPELRKLRYKPFKDLLRTYPEYVTGLGERMDKYVHPFEVAGDDFLSDTDKFGDFGRSLVHLFRNAVDHGIETVEERSAAGKEEYANMICRVTMEAGMITLMIADDGRGIDTEALRKRAADAGVAGYEELRALDDDEVNQLVFRDELSTKEQVSELSGRGIGLSSVKAEVGRLGGEIAVHSQPGEGTVFHITLPADDLSELPQLRMPSVIEPLVETADRFFREQVDIGFDGPPELRRLDRTERLSLQKVTTFINVRGALDGIFVLSVDDGLSRALLHRMIIGELPPEEEERYIEDGIAEAANIILGNSLRRFQILEEFVLMDPPITFHTEGASVKYADSDIWTCRLDSAEGGLLAGFVVLKKSAL